MKPAAERGSGADGQRGSNGRPAYGAAPFDRPTCLRCGFRVSSRAAGCKNPCDNCGTIYPLGDCSD